MRFDIEVSDSVGHILAQRADEAGKSNRAYLAAELEKIALYPEIYRYQSRYEELLAASTEVIARAISVIERIEKGSR